MLCSLLQNRAVGIPARTYIYVTIQPTNAIYVGGAGNTRYPWDEMSGLSLHFMYSANANMNFRTGTPPVPPALPAPDYVPQSINVEFEGPSVFTVPFDGTLTFIGGNLTTTQGTPAAAVDFKAYVYYEGRPCSGRPGDDIDTSNYAPMFHWLKHYPNFDLGSAASFNVPDNHTYLLAQNSTDTVTVNGSVVQPGTNSPGMLVSPGDKVVAATVNQVLITGWLG